MIEFHDIIETSETSPLLLWWQWALIILGSVAVIPLIAFISKQASRKGSKLDSNLGLALDRLQHIKLESTDSSQLATDLSIIVREYLQLQFGDRALFQTEEEFHERSQHIDALPDQAAEKLREYLTDLSQHKYAPSYNHPAALESYVSKAAELLKGIDSTIPRPLTSK